MPRKLNLIGSLRVLLHHLARFCIPSTWIAFVMLSHSVALDAVQPRRRQTKNQQPKSDDLISTQSSTFDFMQEAQTPRAGRQLQHPDHANQAKGSCAILSKLHGACIRYRIPLLVLKILLCLHRLLRYCLSRGFRRFLSSS